MIELKESIHEAFIGFVIGDAIGVPFEFRSKKEMVKNPCTDMIGHGTYNLPKGYWSDDTSLTLATIDAIVTGDYAGWGGDDQLYARLTRYLTDGCYTPDGHVFDIGIATRIGLENYLTRKLQGVKFDWYHFNHDAIDSNGNGALMRMLPIAFLFIHGGCYKGLTRMVLRACTITHNHPINFNICVTYCCIIYELYHRRNRRGTEWWGEDSVGAIDSALNRGVYYPTRERNGKSLEQNRLYQGTSVLKMLQEEDLNPKGYVVSTLEIAIWATLNSSSAKEAILKAVNLGHDTDTNAAVTGSIAGLVFGLTSIPDSWLNNIVKKDEILDNLNVFAEFLPTIDVERLQQD